MLSAALLVTVILDVYNLFITMIIHKKIDNISKKKKKQTYTEEK